MAASGPQIWLLLLSALITWKELEFYQKYFCIFWFLFDALLTVTIGYCIWILFLNYHRTQCPFWASCKSAESWEFQVKIDWYDSRTPKVLKIVKKTLTTPKYFCYLLLKLHEKKSSVPRTSLVLLATTSAGLNYEILH